MQPITPIILDGVSYDIFVVSFKQSFAKLNTDQAGRLESGRMFLDLIGTFYNYTVTFARNIASLSDYDKFYMALSAPVEFNTFTLPHNQGQLTFRAYVSQGERELMKQVAAGNMWGDIPVNITSETPLRYPT